MGRSPTVRAKLIVLMVEEAKLNASAVAQQQELQNLQITVQLARSELNMALSRLESAKSNRKLLE
jgi:hypothetical protein